jgi:hypothetical protein
MVLEVDTLNAAEYAQTLAACTSRMISPFMSVLRLVIIMFIGGVVGTYLGNGDIEKAALAAGPFAVWWIYSVAYASAVRRHCYAERVKSYPVSYTFSDLGIEVKAPNRNSQLQWSALHAWTRTKRGIVVHVAAGTCLAIPARCADLEPLATMLRDKLGAPSAGARK